MIFNCQILNLKFQIVRFECVCFFLFEKQSSTFKFEMY